MRILIGGAVVGAALIGLAGPALATDATPTPGASPPPSPTASPTASPSASPPPSASPSPSGTTNRVDVLLKPSKVAQGGRLSVGATCFTEAGGTAESPAFGQIHLKRGEGGSGAETTVRSNVKPGEYVVKVACAEGGSGQAVLTVVAAQTKEKPIGGAETGGGGAGTATGPAITAGAAGLALAGAGAWIAVRRRRRA